MEKEKNKRKKTQRTDIYQYFTSERSETSQNKLGIIGFPPARQKYGAYLVAVWAADRTWHGPKMSLLSPTKQS